MHSLSGQVSSRTIQQAVGQYLHIYILILISFGIFFFSFLNISLRTSITHKYHKLKWCGTVPHSQKCSPLIHANWTYRFKFNLRHSNTMAFFAMQWILLLHFFYNMKKIEIDRPATFIFQFKSVEFQCKQIHRKIAQRATTYCWIVYNSMCTI